MIGQIQLDVRNRRVQDQFTAHVGQAHTDGAVFGQYVTAIDLMVWAMAEKQIRADVVSYPLCYMMRHALELGYKVNIRYLSRFSELPPPKAVMTKHNLTTLHEELRRQFNETARLTEIDTYHIASFSEYLGKAGKAISQLVAPEASAFRYTRNVQDQEILRFNETRDVLAIKELFDDTVTMLYHTADVIGPFTDRKTILKERPELERIPFVVMPSIGGTQVIRDVLDGQHTRVNGTHWENGDGRILSILEIKSKVYLVVAAQPIS